LERPLWAALLAMLIVVPNLFAMRQFRATGGYLFYSNAFDEATYLSYDGAMSSRSLTHMAEYLVVTLHRMGVSGGYLNLVFDLVCPAVTVVLLLTRRGRARVLGPGKHRLPVCHRRPAGRLRLLELVLLEALRLELQLGWIVWITLPEAYYPPLFRTRAAARLRLPLSPSIWRFAGSRILVALAVAPFIYPFCRHSCTSLCRSP
jgi:hypothetical protein